jgi:hypothetical protein
MSARAECRVQVADRVGFELALSGLVAFDVGQSGDAMALQASGAATIASGAGSLPAGHTGHRPAGAACVGGRRRRHGIARPTLIRHTCPRTHG